MAEHSGWYHKCLTRFGIEHTFVDMTDIEAVKKAIQPNTKAILRGNTFQSIIEGD